MSQQETTHSSKEEIILVISSPGISIVLVSTKIPILTSNYVFWGEKKVLQFTFSNFLVLG